MAIQKRFDKKTGMVVDKEYIVSGNQEIGFRLAIPTIAKRSKRYSCDVRDDGTLIYVPVVQ